MDGMSDDMTYVVTKGEQFAMSNPFGDTQCAAMDVDKSINVTQLANEIGVLAGLPVMVSMISAPDHKPRIYVCPVVSEEVLTQAVNDHRADDHYGMDRLQRKRQELRTKLSSSDELSLVEMRDVLILMHEALELALES